jgi:hypothetical protein
MQSPQSAAQLLAAFEEQEQESLRYWTTFDDEAFFRKIGTSWSPAETVRHLTKSNRPVVKALGMPRLVLWLMFGKPRRASMTYDALQARYLQGLAEGGQAGRFAPSQQEEQDLGAWRRSIMGQYTGVSGGLRKAIARWSDRRLDRYQLPHPLLGKLTVREMLFFTLYHQRHHMAVVERRMRETAGTADPRKTV